MSQSDEGQPLSRRERRLREMAETGLLPTVSSEDADSDVASEVLEFEPEISPTNPDGSVRSRRELRELREQAIAEYEEAELAKTQEFSLEDLEAALAAGSEESEADPEAADDGDADETVADAAESDVVDSEEVDTGDVEAAEVDVVEADVLEADDDAEAEAAESTLTEPAAEEADAEAVVVVVEDSEADEDIAAAAEAVAEAEAVAIESDAESAIDSAESEADAEVEAGSGESTEADAAEDDSADAVSDIDDELEADEPSMFAAKSAARDGYSFPDIAPLDDGISVFDNPESPSALRAADAEAEAETPSDFDDLITSAVAQEGSGSTTSTSALILPNMGHTGQLSGPLGETGELFVTGSFELPRSLGETGGHARLLDSVDEDADDLPAAAFGSTGDDGGMAPVSAANAVSARSTGSMVSSPATEKSRVPTALIMTGGGLIIIIAGLAVWAASTGFFG